jgi:hypothetical protein
VQKRGGIIAVNLDNAQMGQGRGARKCVAHG